jgi:hypothetical protein
MEGMIPRRCDFCLNVVDETGRHVDGFAEARTNADGVTESMNVPDPGNDPDFCRKVLRSQLRSAQRAYKDIFNSQTRWQEERAAQARLAAAEQARHALGEQTTPFRD